MRGAPEALWHARLDGSLAAIELVLIGICAEMIPIEPGDDAFGDFGSLGEVRASFTRDTGTCRPVA